jgi:regulator of sigma E protease
MLMLTTDAVQQGFFSVVGLAATISIALGIFNLLPVYPMDGGQMVVAIAELLRGGRRLSIRVQTVMGTVGLGLLALMAIGAITVDIGRWTEKPAPNGPPMPAKEPKK